MESWAFALGVRPLGQATAKAAPTAQVAPFVGSVPISRTVAASGTRPSAKMWISTAALLAVLAISGILLYRTRSKGSQITGGVSYTPSPAQKLPESVSTPRSGLPTTRSAPGKEAAATIIRPVETVWNPSISFESSTTDIVKGAQVTLTWRVENAADTKLDGGSVESQGKRVISPSSDTTYHLVATGPNGASKSQDVTVHVIAPVPPAVQQPAITAFEVVPATVEQCSIAILRWTVRGASRVSIDSGIGAVDPTTGYRTIRALTTNRYTLTADGPGGSVSHEVTLSVSPGTKSSCGQ